MKKIKWGIIGCGDVTELKSGPAFSKVPNSQLVAVMRRDAAKAKDYAERHKVPRWYSNANLLINDEEVNAVYIATPPSSHKEFAIAAIRAGKHVYVEKPMTINYPEAKLIAEMAAAKNIKMVVAHYRREQPLFKKIKQLLDEKEIGEVLHANLICYASPLSKKELAIPKAAWRVDPSIAGGGLFHDLAPHQLDLMYYFFGSVNKASGIAINQGKNYAADDMVMGNILFNNGITFSSSWCFNAAKEVEMDYCEIIGTGGKLSFSIFGEPVISVFANHKKYHITFTKLQHVQQPMIEQTVNYFLGKAPNPCSGEEGAEVMKLIDAFTSSNTSV